MEDNTVLFIPFIPLNFILSYLALSQVVWWCVVLRGAVGEVVVVIKVYCLLCLTVFDKFRVRQAGRER